MKVLPMVRKEVSVEQDCSFAGLFVSLCCESCVNIYGLFMAETAQDPTRDSAEPLNVPLLETGKSENAQMSDALAEKKPGGTQCTTSLCTYL